MVDIKGFGDTLTVNNICIGNLSPEEHEKIEKLKGGNNYKPLENVVVSHVKDSSTLICRKPSKDEITPFIEEELLDGLCCYSAVNQGQLNEKITNAIIKHLKEEKLPTVPRSIRHKYMSAFLLATTGITQMDRIVPKVAGVEAPELMFKLAERNKVKIPFTSIEEVRSAYEFNDLQSFLDIYYAGSEVLIQTQDLLI